MAGVRGVMACGLSNGVSCVMVDNSLMVRRERLRFEKPSSWRKTEVDTRLGRSEANRCLR